jgi:hypothetical protein
VGGQKMIPRPDLIKKPMAGWFLGLGKPVGSGFPLGSRAYVVIFNGGRKNAKVKQV